MVTSVSQMLKQVQENRPGRSSVLVPGVFNAISARLAEMAGFECAYVSGTAVASANYGLPDIGLIGRAEMASNCDLISNAVSIPLIADADTGYGEGNAIKHTVTAFMRAGASAVTIEDQVLQKRCGYTEGVRLVPADIQARRIRAACIARGDNDLVVVGRTDSLAGEGLESAIDRCRIMTDAGADVVWIVGLQRYESETLREVRGALSSPAMVDYTELASTPRHSFEELGMAGYELVLVAMSAILASLDAMASTYDELKLRGDWMGYRDRLMPFDKYNELAGFGAALKFEEEVDGNR